MALVWGAPAALIWGAPAPAAAASAAAASAPAPAPASAGATPSVTVFTDQVQSSPFWGLGVEFDPYDTLAPSQLNWPLITQRLDFMSPGFLRVVEPASKYFGGYDASGNPTYRWTAPSVQELLSILSYAQARGIPVLLGDWADPLIGGDARIPADFLSALRNTYGFSVVRYYNVVNEPNDAGASCAFSCWAQIMRSVAAELAQVGLAGSVSLVGPDNANSWDDTPAAQALDISSGLDSDNPVGGDSWVTASLQSIPSLIGAYDSHRYATISGIQTGVYGDQVRARRLEISNLDTAAKPFFAGEVGVVARQTDPFTADEAPRAITRPLAALLGPSAVSSQATFVDSQPHIAEFDYGVWMADMMVQAINAGLSGASAWDLDDAMHTGGGYGAANLKRWGFWNSLAGQDGYPAGDLQPRPWFYAWSVLSRAFPAGSQPLVLPSSQATGVRVAADRIPDGGGADLSVAIVNDSATPQTVTLTIPSVTGRMTLARYDDFATDAPVDANDLPVPAQILRTEPAQGISVTLPSSGLIVLTSRGYTPPTALDQGTTARLDDLRGWQETYSHVARLKLDTSTPARFNYATSRATPSGKRPEMLVYRALQMTSFDLDAYYAKSLGLQAFGSTDGVTWSPIALASTQPAPAVGGHELLAQLLPARPLPAGTNRLKIELAAGTELAQVQIAANRSGPACVSTASNSGAISGHGVPVNSIAGLTPGRSQRSILDTFGVPSTGTARVWRYCTTIPGQLAIVYARGSAELIGTTTGVRLGAVAIGTPLGRLLHHYRKTALTAAGQHLLIAATGVIYTIRARAITAESLATPTLLVHRGALILAIKRAGLS
jgi:hypothetical protein